MKSLFLTIGGAFLAASAFAQQAPVSAEGPVLTQKPFVEVESVGLHLASHHWPDKGENNTNPGGFVKFRIGDVSGFVIGDYYNSRRKNTFYVGKDWEIASQGKFSESVQTAIGTGYVRKITPIVAFSLAYSVTEKSSVRLSYIPYVKKMNEVSVLHLSVEYKF